MVFGEYYFGRHLDMPHGPDMVLGGMIGAGAGALVAWLVTNGRSTSTSCSAAVPTAAQSGGGGPEAITITKLDVQFCDSL